MVASVNAPQSGRLFGRDEIVERILDNVLTSSAPPVIVVTGPFGIGRSSVLARIGEKLSDRGVVTLGFQVTRNERRRPDSVIVRLEADLDALAGERTAARPTSVRQASAGRRAGSGTDASAGKRLSATLGAALAAHGRLVVLLDDLQWIDAGSLAALEPMVRALAGASITVVGALAPLGPGETALPTLDRLRAAGLADVLALRPLNAAQTNALITETLQARPSAELTATVHRCARGRPAAVLAAVRGYQRSEALRMAYRHAYLVHPGPPELPAGDAVFDHLRRLDPPGWPVAKALAVLHPLGEAAPGLIAEAVGISEEQVIATLHALRTAGVVQAGPAPRAWRFRLPLLALSLNGCLGQYERRQLAQLAVTALWSAAATCPDESYLLEQLVSAGRFVDTERATNELLAHGCAVMIGDGYHAQRWLRAAVDLLIDPPRRAWALFLHAATCTIHMMFARAAVSTRQLLAGHAGELPPDAVLELEMVHIVALLGLSERTSLEEIASDGWRSLPGSDGHRIVIRGACLCMLDRFRDAHELFASTRQIWTRGNDAVTAFGLIFSAGTDAFLGEPAEFERFVADPSIRPLFDVERHRLEQVAELARILMTFGDLDRAARLLVAYEVQPQHRPRVDLVIEAGMSGQWDQALDLGRQVLATGASLGYIPAHVAMVREMATILTARGRPFQARTMIDKARSDQPLLTHLLNLVEAELERLLGADDRSRQLLVDGLATAAEGGLVIGTDELWSLLGGFELAAGKTEAAQRCADEAGRVADMLDTGRARRNQLLARAIAYHDGAAAAQAVRLARHRAQPFELANTLADVASHRLADQKLLLEAYELYADLGALLPRARLRHMMRTHAMTVPGRNATVAENERLLASLVTEGLTNRQLAVALQTSEKSVEGRLSRLFQRTGYRSRVELATAMLTGEYPA